MPTYLCTCNKCGGTWQDPNPSEDSVPFGDHISPSFVSLNKNEEEHFWQCPECRTDGYLMDITEDSIPGYLDTPFPLPGTAPLPKGYPHFRRLCRRNVEQVKRIYELGKSCLPFELPEDIKAEVSRFRWRNIITEETPSGPYYLTQLQAATIKGFLERSK